MIIRFFPILFKKDGVYKRTIILKWDAPKLAIIQKPNSIRLFIIIYIHLFFRHWIF